MRRPLSTRGLTAIMMLALLLALLSLLVYSAQLHRLKALWSLSNAEAGLISSAYFIGYTIAVPFLASLTDRVDPKRVYVAGALCLAAGMIGFGLAAGGLVSASVFQAIAGLGLAGTYMPGLKGLLDHVPPAQHSRVNAYYASGFGLGAALSFPFGIYVGAWLGWQWAFYGAGAAALLAGAVVWALLPSTPADRLAPAPRRMRDFLPVLRNRAALAYGVAYGLHCWELFALRTWVIAFLVYAQGLQGAASAILVPAFVAALLTVIGIPGYIAGNELAMRLGRRRVAGLVMLASALVSALVGLAPGLSYAAAALACVLLGVTASADSIALTAGALGNAAPGYRGATMALHSMLGFAGATIGPLSFGWALDLAGGQTPAGWWVAFAHLSIISLLGFALLAGAKPSSIPGDRV